MKPKRIHHIGIVLPRLEQARAIMDMFALEFDYSGYVDAYKADVHFTKSGQWESPIEFIIPREGVLADYNNGKGGIHHICFEVEDVAAATREFQEKGYDMLESSPVVAFEGHIFNFMRPRSSQGILFEFMQELNPRKR